MNEIRGEAQSIRALLSGAKYSIDYYQREYRWESKQINELLEDLAEKFTESHSSANERTAIVGYGHYFLGSIIISDKEGRKYIIDGQQRLTSEHHQPRQWEEHQRRTCAVNISVEHGALDHSACHIEVYLLVGPRKEEETVLIPN